MKNRLLLLMALIVAGATSVKAQIDPHFSQYYANPLWLNPALTGITNGDLRLTGNYKNQWANVGNAYQTVAVAADGRPSDRVSVGLNVLDQRAGSAGFNYLTAYGSFAYNITVSADGNQKINFGVQAGFINRSFDMSKTQFGSQYNPNSGFDPSMPSFESFSNSSTTVFDANAGIFYYDGDPLSTINPFAGVSVGHLSRPNDPFSGTGKGKVPLRYTFHGGLRIKASELFDITPNALYIQQQKTNEFAMGAYSELKFQQSNGLIMGAMYRIHDAAIADVGYHVNNTIIGVSYDFNTTSLSRATNGMGGLELSISYVFHKRIQEPEPICPRL